MYRLYIKFVEEKWYFISNSKTRPFYQKDKFMSYQFRTIEAANSKAHELNLDEYYIEDERGETVYPMKPEVIDPTQHEQTK